MTEVCNFVVADEETANLIVRNIPGTGTDLRIVISSLRCRGEADSPAICLRFGNSGVFRVRDRYESVLDSALRATGRGNHRGQVFDYDYAVIAEKIATDRTSDPGARGAILVEVPDYANSHYPKSFFARHTSPPKRQGLLGTNIRMQMSCGMWDSTKAITDIELSVPGLHFCPGTRIRVVVE